MTWRTIHNVSDVVARHCSCRNDMAQSQRYEKIKGCGTLNEQMAKKTKLLEVKDYLL